MRHDSTDTSISFDFVNALAFGPRGQVWYGTVGNGWGVSVDGGRTWKNWTYDQLGPEWQYVTPDGIATRGDTTVIATADGLQITTDDGAHWIAIGDRAGPPARGPADSALPLLDNEYVKRLGPDREGVDRADPAWHAAAPGSRVEVVGGSGRQGVRSPRRTPSRSVASPIAARCAASSRQAIWRRASRRMPHAAEPPRAPLTVWLRRPIAREDNWYIDQTYRYGSTFGGTFQQHQGVEFNNPDGTPVHAVLAGTVVHSGPAEQGALTVTIRHDTTVTAGGTTYRLYSTYYHNSALNVKVGDRVKTGQVISRVGNTGRATNDHLHLELSASPTDSLGAIVDSTQRFPPYTTNAELWIEPLPGTGIVAGQVFDSAGAPVRQARIHGLVETRARRDALLLRRDLRGSRALPPVVRRTLRGERRAGGHLRHRDGDRRPQGPAAGDGRTREAHLGGAAALMFIELTDHLRCPEDHDEQFWCLLPDRLDGRSVKEGQLGCPVCGANLCGAGWSRGLRRRSTR